jgi:hypothetical protein
VNQVEAIAAIQAVRGLRRVNYESAIARKIEMFLCGELLLAMATIWTDQDLDCLGSGYKCDTLRSVCIGIIRGRPGEGPQPWRLA